MEVKRIIRVGRSWAVTLSPQITRILGASGGDYVEMFMADKNTLVVRKHNLTERKRTING